MAAASYYNTPSNIHLGGSSTHFNHPTHSNIQTQYNDLRTSARTAHSRNDHSTGARLNKQASGLIFRENNSPDRVAPDTIDLHGQYVNEAEDILELRIREAKRRGEAHLHVIVGKGNHSAGHVQRIKPKVEALCREEGLRYRTEENEGRIFVDLRGGGLSGVPDMPPVGHVGAPGYGGRPAGAHYGGGGGGGGYPGRPQQGMEYQQQQEQGGKKESQDPVTKCIRSCCSVM
ncbi:MAG: hypothetical protein M1831_002301 [Alyxoria varia]|nr:MAG: hypothetical protein M1831_002301 [Alyxoria varia]